MRRITYLLAAAAISTILVGVQSANAQEPVVQTLTAECTTGGTGADGARKTCESQAQTVRAPAGHVFSAMTMQKIEVDRMGSGPGCDWHIQWGDYVEIVPGVSLPSSLTVKVRARSPALWGGILRKGVGARGRIKCRYEVVLGKYQ